MVPRTGAVPLPSSTMLLRMTMTSTVPSPGGASQTILPSTTCPESTEIVEDCVGPVPYGAGEASALPPPLPQGDRMLPRLKYVLTWGTASEAGPRFVATMLTLKPPAVEKPARGVTLRTEGLSLEKNTEVDVCPSVFTHTRPVRILNAKRAKVWLRTTALPVKLHAAFAASMSARLTSADG